MAMVVLPSRVKQGDESSVKPLLCIAAALLKCDIHSCALAVLSMVAASERSPDEMIWGNKVRIRSI